MEMQKEMSVIEKKMGELVEELLEEIFSRVPFKPLATMKCVSKDWCRLISHLQTSRLDAIASGLITLQSCYFDEKCVSEDPPLRTPLQLFEVKDQGGQLVYLENNALGFTLHGFTSIRSLCCSNGLLLCCHVDQFAYDPFLYDLFLKQQISLPSFDEFIEGQAYGIGLAFDGNRNHHFKVVCFVFGQDVKFLDCMIFSSETGEWRKHRARLENSSIIDEDIPYGNSYYCSKIILPFECLFHEGLIYWSISGYFLVYNLQEEFFEIHNLPTKDLDEERITWPLDECFWVSEGSLHYCYSDKDGFSVWTRMKGEEIDYNDEYYQDIDNVLIHYHYGHDKGWWKWKHSVDLQTLKAQHPEFSDRIYFLRPCSFNQEFQTLYLNLAGSLVMSYSFETGCLREVKELKPY